MVRGRGSQATNSHLRSPLAWLPVIMTRNVVVVEDQKLIWGAPVGYLLKSLEGRFGCTKWGRGAVPASGEEAVMAR